MVGTKYKPMISVFEIRTKFLSLGEQCQGRAPSGRPKVVGMLVGEEVEELMKASPSSL